MKVTIKGILHMMTSPYSDAQSYQIFASDMSSLSDKYSSYVPIKEVEAEFDIPDDFDPRPGMVAGLREKKKEILAEAHMKANEIEERIQTLLCLEFKGDAP